MCFRGGVGPKSFDRNCIKIVPRNGVDVKSCKVVALDAHPATQSKPITWTPIILFDWVTRKPPVSNGLKVRCRKLHFCLPFVRMLSSAAAVLKAPLLRNWPTRGEQEFCKRWMKSNKEFGQNNNKSDNSSWGYGWNRFPVEQHKDALI